MSRATIKMKLENYWYYYKIQTIAFLFIAIVTVVLVRQCATKITPDLTVVIATEKMIDTADVQNEIQDYLSGFTSDVNGDGEKAVQCQFINLGDQSTVQAMQAKLTVNLISNDSFIYVFDDYTVNTYLADQINGTFVKINDILPEEKIDNPYGLPVSNTKLADQKFSNYLSGLRIYVRSYSKTDKDKSYTAEISNALNLIKNIAS